jgi:ribosomal protein S18 acetylase RimI-like enzyme
VEAAIRSARHPSAGLAELIISRHNAGMAQQPDIIVLDADAAMAAVDELADVLADCVAGGASVSFMQPYDAGDAAGFFSKVAGSVARGDTVLLAARHGGRIVGTVQLGLDTPPNQPHRADIKKLLVHRSARGMGIGAALMQQAERIARDKGRILLVLDTASGAAERLYVRGGWQRAGIIPDYAMWPDGGFCDTTIFWKKL